jgi:Hypothetical protein (DUF2513)
VIGGFAPQEFIIDGYPDDQVAYHVYLLGQAGLLEVVKNTNLVSSAPSAHALNMTWEGHDFIDAARSGFLAQTVAFLAREAKKF